VKMMTPDIIIISKANTENSRQNLIFIFCVHFQISRAWSETSNFPFVFFVQLQRPPVIIYKMDRGYDTNFTDDDVVGGARTPITCYSSTHTRITTTTTTKDVTLCAFSIWWMMIEREIISLFVHQNPRRTGHDRNIQQKYPQTQSYSFSQPRFIFKYKVYTIIERDSLYANEGIYVYRRKEIFDSWLIFAFISIRHLKV
jgi:hypothetical protein